MRDIRKYLQEGAPLLFDGAMGTFFASMHGREDQRCELANLRDPETISAIHRAYLQSGAQAIKTNTFSVSSDLAAGEFTLAEEIITAGCRIAKEAAESRDAWVFASIGPAPEEGAFPPGGNYCHQADLFLAQNVSHFLLETMPSDLGIPEFAAYLKSRRPDAFLIVSFAVSPDGMTRAGLEGAELLEKVSALAEVDAVGFNCVSGPQHLLDYIRTLPPTGRTLSVMPNAGYPTVLGRRMVFQGAADYFGQKLAEIAAAGASIVGGCCGTTPEHIAAAIASLKAPLRPAAQPRISPRRREAEASDAVGQKFAAGERVIAVELDPPPDGDASFFLSGVQTLRDAGADLVTIADCPVGRPRADSSLLACKIRRELHVEPLPHMTCRDRNLNAIKALLLGLAMEQVRNVLLVTGDPIPSEIRDEVKTVFNFNSRKLIHYVKNLNETVLDTPFRIFGALNVNARNFDKQLELAREKEEFGAAGFLTQPVLSREALENLRLARSTLRGVILGGVYPVVSYKNACFLNNEIAGMHVSADIVARYQGKNRAESEQIAEEISCRIASEMAPWTDGWYFITPFRRVELMARILKRMRG